MASRRSPLIILMLVTTGVWVVSIVLVGVYLYRLQWAGATPSRHGYLHYNLMGELVDSPADRFESGTIRSSVRGGLCCPTIPYTAVMLLLFIFHLGWMARQEKQRTS